MSELGAEHDKLDKCETMSRFRSGFHCRRWRAFVSKASTRADVSKQALVVYTQAFASRVFQACACGENANVLVPCLQWSARAFLFCERSKMRLLYLHKLVHLRNLKNALVVNAQAFLFEMLQACACGDASFVSRTVRQACTWGVTLNFLSRECF